MSDETPKPEVCIESEEIVALRPNVCELGGRLWPICERGTIGCPKTKQHGICWEPVALLYGD